MHIFKRKKPIETQLAASIKDVPNYLFAIEFLQDWFDNKVVVEKVQLFDCYGDLKVEAVWDQNPKARYWTLYPSSINEEANFDNFLSLPLNSLSAGVYASTLVVGKRKTIVNRNYVDGFIHCMEDVYEFPLQKIRVLLNKSKTYPIILTTDILSFSIAPILGIDRNIHELAWEKGKYNPKSKILSQQQNITIKKLDISFDLNKLLQQVKDGGIVVIYRCPHCSVPLKIGKDTRVEQLKKCEYCDSELQSIDIAEFLRTALS